MTPDRGRSDRPKPKREWASLSAAGIEIRWDRDHPLFQQGRRRIFDLIMEGYVR